jgi:hypothetical protein
MAPCEKGFEMSKSCFYTCTIAGRSPKRTYGDCEDLSRTQSNFIVAWKTRAIKGVDQTCFPLPQAGGKPPGLPLPYYTGDCYRYDPKIFLAWYKKQGTYSEVLGIYPNLKFFFLVIQVRTMGTKGRWKMNPKNMGETIDWEECTSEIIPPPRHDRPKTLPPGQMGKHGLAPGTLSGNARKKRKP